MVGEDGTRALRGWLRDMETLRGAVDGALPLEPQLLLDGIELG